MSAPRGKNNFGYKVLVVLTGLVVLANFMASGYRYPFYHGPNPDPDPDSTTNNTKLRYPIQDKTGDAGSPGRSSIDLKDPPNLNSSVEYNPEDGNYYLVEKVGNEYVRNPTYLTMEEYLKYKGQQDEQNYWKQRMDALSMFNKKPELPTMYKEGLFDRIFGGTAIQVRPQGNVDVTFGGNWQNIQNPTLVRRAQKYGVFDFDMQMNINLLATIGDKLKLNINNNTKATFDYQNMQKIEYSGKEDEILKKVEAGNVSFPLKSSLISGVQSLFGIKTQLQFGKVWVTGVVSQQKSKRQSMTIQGGAQAQSFSIKADDYEENKHFLLAHYFRNNYNTALKNFPVISSLITINKIEVWVTNRTGATDGVRDVLAFMDLGEKAPYQTSLTSASGADLPDNRSNNLYDMLLQNGNSRKPGLSTTAAIAVGLTQGRDFESVSVRKLNQSEYYFNPQLGYISINNTTNPDDVLAVAFRYTYNGKVYQVGEFAEDFPPDSTNQKTIFLKLLKGTTISPTLPIWQLMMKNVYALNGMGVSKEDFRLNVLYQDPGGGEKRYIPDGPNAGVPLLTLLNLDRLNFQNDPSPDGVFDFVEGITINTQQGKIIFPVLEPFGRDFAPSLGGDPLLERKYLYNILYDSTKTIARQFQQNNRFVIKGNYKSSTSSEIFLGGFNIPQGSVSVSAGGQRLVENVDYQIDYGLGRIKILNAGIMNSGIPINVQYEDNATFGFQQQNFMGARVDFFANPKLTLGGTFMRLTERPFTQKTTFGEDPIKNSVLGLDVNYQTESMWITRILDKLPVYSTTAPSFLSVSAEGAAILPGHPQQINGLDPEGSVYIDDFEGTRTSYDLKFPAMAWTMASTPSGAKDKNGNILFPESTTSNNLEYGMNRSRLAWYYLEPTLIDGVGGIPTKVKSDPNQHYIRLVQQQDVFPDKTYATLQSQLSTLDLGYYPRDKGPYNFDARNITADGKLTNPQTRWAGIMRPVEYSDFEAANVEFVEFWLMDPFINNPTAQGGSFYLNLGNVSEDVLNDSRRTFENGVPYPKDYSKLDTSTSKWAYVPLFQQQVTRAFDNDPAARTAQDVGYDCMDNEEEKMKHAGYLQALLDQFGPTAKVYQDALNDPAGDDFIFYRDERYTPDDVSVLTAYKLFNNSQGNSPATTDNSAYSSAATTIPETEDINRDNSLSATESYFEYRMDIRPNMEVGANYIVDKKTTNVKLPNGETEPETWYQFKIPIREYTQKVGSIGDFRSIRFIRLFMTGFEDSVIMRFAKLELGRNQWRQYQFSLQTPGENIPESEKKSTNFTVTSVSIEENSKKVPVPYVLPPGVNRQLSPISNGQTIQQNEQSLALQVCALKDGDARAVFKEVNVDIRQFEKLRMFIHAESQVGQTVIKDGEMRAIIRMGSDFTNNYYEYQIPLKITPDGARLDHEVWPEANRFDVVLDDLVAVKTARNSAGFPSYVPYQALDSKGNTVVVVGNPNFGEVKTIMLGVLNPKKTNNTPNDDGLAKCIEVWFNELRMVGMNEQAGYAATGKLNLQLADLGSVRLGGGMHTAGYGNIDQKLNQRFRDNFYQYDASTNLNLGKMMPKKWGVQLPFFAGYSQTISNPQYNPYDMDVKYSDAINSANNAAQRDSVRKIAQDFVGITSINLSNVRISPERKPTTKKMPWHVENFDVSYSYNKQYRRNPLIESDELTTQKLGLGYTYPIKSKPIEPFKKLIKSKNKWYGLVKDFNLTPLPTSFTFRTELNKIFNETQVRNVSDGPYAIDPTYYKNFTWLRTYNLRWELTKSLSFDYNATNNSRIDEPYGKIDNKAKRDTMWERFSTLGRNTYFAQNFNASYNVPMQKIPLLDWTNVRATYGSTYTWTAASRLAESLGNTIGNTQTKQINGEFNLVQLYNKNRWLKAANQPPKLNARNIIDKVGADGKKQAGVQMVSNKVPDAIDLNKKDDPQKDGGDKQPTSQSAVKKPTKKTILDSIMTTINTDGMTDAQLDSVRKRQLAQIEAREKAEKAKRKAERKAARLKRRNTVPQLSPGARFAGRFISMLRRVTVNYTENSGTVLPGYMDSTRLFGVNTASGMNGLDYAFGLQPTGRWVEAQGEMGRLSRDSIFNAQFQQQYSQNFTVNATLEPIQDLRIDVSMTRSFTKSHNELFKDTGTGKFEHLNPYETGSFNMSYIGLKSLFKSSGTNGNIYKQFVANREVISQRQGDRNPYTNGTTDPNDPNYQKGYTQYSQDVLIPAFLAAYGGKNAKDIALIDYSNQSIRSNPFKYYRPAPNWKLTYNGLNKLPAVAKYLNNLVVNHAYTGTMSMSSFVTSMYYQDLYNAGFPSFIDSTSGNYIPYFQIPNLTITEQLNPLLGFDMSMKNNMTARLEFRKNRTVSLSLIDYQISETKSTEYVFGLGYRVKGLVLPVEIFGVKQLKNDLNIKVDVGIRDDKTTNTYLAQNIDIVTRGQKVITITPSIDYIVSDKVTLRFFFDRRQSIPYISNSYPITTTKAGVTLRFIFAN